MFSPPPLVNDNNQLDSHHQRGDAPNIGVEPIRRDQNPQRLAYTASETCHLLGGISARSLRRLEQRGLLLPSRGLRIKLYSRQAIEKYLGATQ
jgi:hypothetical protein